MYHGYCRVSSRSQENNYSFAAQEATLIAAGVPSTHIVNEVISGTEKIKPKLNSLLETMQSGDTLFVARLDRFARNTSEALIKIESLDNRGIKFVALDIGGTDSSPEIRKMILSIFLSLATFETEVRKSRQAEGIALAKLDPTKYRGKKSLLTASFLEKVKNLKAKGVNASLIANALQVSRPTIYKALRLLRTSNE